HTGDRLLPGSDAQAEVRRIAEKTDRNAVIFKSFTILFPNLFYLAWLKYKELDILKSPVPFIIYKKTYQKGRKRNG
ncbi:MAG: hypothetical protein ACI4SZ_04040, partial [Lachnospiraceae bacterium]